MNQVPIMQPIYPVQGVNYALPQQPSYNAVKIDIHNPSVGAPGWAIPRKGQQYGQQTDYHRRQQPHQPRLLRDAAADDHQGRHLHAGDLRVPPDAAEDRKRASGRVHRGGV